MNRRTFVTSSLGVALTGGLAGAATAAEPSAQEQANIKIVNEFCAAFAAHDLARVLGAFAEGGVYRMTETTEPAKGHDALATRIGSYFDRVGRFEILETFARGPMVVNERRDSFTSGPLRAWHGVGVFFLKDGKIVEWHDYTIALERG